MEGREGGRRGEGWEGAGGERREREEEDRGRRRRVEEGREERKASEEGRVDGKETRKSWKVRVEVSEEGLEDKDDDEGNEAKKRKNS